MDSIWQDPLTLRWHYAIGLLVCGPFTSRAAAELNLTIDQANRRVL